MKQVTKMHVWAFAMTLAASAVLTGCEKDLFDPNAGKPGLPDIGTFPDFNTRSTVSLSVDYQEPGFKALVEVFTEYPYELSPQGNVVRKAIEPVFAAYTDNNTKLAAHFPLATDVKQIYLHCPSMGMPNCVEVDVVNDRIDFKTSDLNAVEGRAGTRAIINSPTIGTKAPWKIANESRLFSLCQWGAFGKPSAPAKYLDNVTGTQQMLGAIQSMLWNGKASKPNGLDNSQYAKESKYTNISIAKFIRNDKGETVPVESAGIKLNFLQEAAWNQNTLGYYYYPTDQVPATAADVKMRYILFPNLSTGDTPPFGARGDGGLFYLREDAPLNKNQQVTLLYVNEQGEVSERFPPGYTIGWFIIPNGANRETINTGNGYVYSNEKWNSGGKKTCIALNYKDEKVVLGFEDGPDKSYEDLLFYVESDPKGAIINPDQPVIKPEEKPEAPDSHQSTKGTYLFEDLWPVAGDYDMNDVMVEYKRVVWFNKDNMVTKIEDTFEAKQPPRSSSYNNAFAYQVDPSQVGTFTLTDGVTYEAATNSFVIFADSRVEKDVVYKVTREFKTGSFLKKDLKAYNPFIIVKYIPEDKNRVEVHLPKMMPTAYADKALVGTGEDAYYVDKGGKYPFALDLPIHGFLAVKENKKPIGEVEYTGFTKWVESGCTTNTDWYLHQ